MEKPYSILSLRNGFARFCKSIDILTKVASKTDFSFEEGTNSLPKIFRDPEYVLPLPIASGQTMGKLWQVMENLTARNLENT